MAHWAQAMRLTEPSFPMFDYGTSCRSLFFKPQPCNQDVYGQDTPPEYDLDAVRVPIALATGARRHVWCGMFVSAAPPQAPGISWQTQQIQTFCWPSSSGTWCTITRNRRLSTWTLRGHTRQRRWCTPSCWSLWTGTAESARLRRWFGRALRAYLYCTTMTPSSMLFDAAGQRVQGRQALASIVVTLPRDAFHDCNKVVYICQGEFGVASANDDVILTTADATTCVILALHCPDTGTSVLAHLDSSNVDVTPTLHHTQRPRAYLAGAFNASSHALLHTLLTALDAAPQPITLEVAAVGERNVDQQGRPIITALSLHAPTGTVWQGCYRQKTREALTYFNRHCPRCRARCVVRPAHGVAVVLLCRGQAVLCLPPWPPAPACHAPHHGASHVVCCHAAQA